MNTKSDCEILVDIIKDCKEFNLTDGKGNVYSINPATVTGVEIKMDCLADCDDFENKIQIVTTNSVIIIHCESMTDMVQNLLSLAGGINEVGFRFDAAVKAADQAADGGVE